MTCYRNISISKNVSSRHGYLKWIFVVDVELAVARCNVVLRSTHPICSLIYGSTGANDFDQLAKTLTG